MKEQLEHNKLTKNVSRIQKGELTVIAGRAKSGKTTCLQKILKDIAFKNIPVAFFSLEYSQGIFFRKFLKSHLNLNVESIVNNDLAKLEHICEEIANYPIYLDDSSQLTREEYFKKTMLAKKHIPDLSLIIFDYLQLIDTDKHMIKKEKFIMKDLKFLAKKLNVAIVVADQLSPSFKPKDSILSYLQLYMVDLQDIDNICLLQKRKVGKHWNIKFTVTKSNTNCMFSSNLPDVEFISNE